MEQVEDLSILDYVYKTQIEIPENITMDVVAILDRVYQPITCQYIIDQVSQRCRDSKYKTSVIVKDVPTDSILSDVADAVLIVSILGNNEGTHAFMTDTIEFVKECVQYNFDGASKFNETRSAFMSEE